jgi:hypothetical protein
MATVDHPTGGLMEGRFDGFMLSAQIKKWYFHKTFQRKLYRGRRIPRTALFSADREKPA